MATYAIGDVQGCYEELTELLDVIDFRSDRDRLWLLGDLINRGRQNVAVVKRVMALGSAAVTVLGNHDLHFLAVHRGGHSMTRADTFGDLLAHKKVDDMSDWLRYRRLIHRDKSLGYVMAHAGIPHLWTLKQARALAREVEEVIRGPRCEVYFRKLYGNEPSCWQDKWDGMPRWRVITNYLTRMRLLYPDGRLDFAHKGALSEAPKSLKPWFDLRALRPLRLTLLFGHWAALEGHTGHEDIIALDTGCVWGRTLTALKLEDGSLVSVGARSVKYRN
jgi:bis(5'-nucleosyl)-tetraphosphatase (symmetrical)